MQSLCAHLKSNNCCLRAFQDENFFVALHVPFDLFVVRTRALENCEIFTAVHNKHYPVAIVSDGDTTIVMWLEGHQEQVENQLPDFTLENAHVLSKEFDGDAGNCLFTQLALLVQHECGAITTKIGLSKWYVMCAFAKSKHVSNKECVLLTSNKISKSCF